MEVFSDSCDLFEMVKARHAKRHIDVFIVDEAQFLTREQVYQLARIVDEQDIPVIAYGLKTDFRGELFPGSYHLLCLAGATAYPTNGRRNGEQPRVASATAFPNHGSMTNLRAVVAALLLAGVAGPALPAHGPAAPARAVAPAVAAEIELAPDLRLLRIGDGAYVVRHDCPFVCNSVLVEMPDGTFVFGGTPGFPEAARLVLDWIEREHGARPVVAIA